MPSTLAFAPPFVLSPSSGLPLRAAAARAHPADTPGWLRQRVKFLARALRRPRLTQVWLARLVQPDLAPLWAARPRLATKLQRPYVSAAWDSTVRCAALLGHYDLLACHFSPAARAAIYGRGLELLRLAPGTGKRRLAVRLSYQDQFEKEGELTLALDDLATGLTLAGLTFCLARHGAEPAAIIGGLQASPDPRIRALIHDTAKDFHGLRPKALALWCLQQLAAGWRLGRLEAVGDAQHIYRHRQKRREFAASYDEFWRESDGRELPGGGAWALPLAPRQRSREELKPTRRKQHERRYALLAALRPRLLAACAAHAPGGAPPAETPEFSPGAPVAECPANLAAHNHSF